MCEEEEKEIFGLLSELWKSMNKVCLDTDSLIALFRNNPDAVKRAEKYDSMNAEISTTSINAFKIYFGAFKSRNAAKNV